MSASGGGILCVENEEELEHIIQSENKLILVLFKAVWCHSCKVLAPVMQKLAASYTDILIVEIDIDISNELACKYEVSILPTLVVIKNRNILTKLCHLDEKKIRMEIVKNI